MKFITRKSECRRTTRTLLVKSPKEAIKRTLSNYEIRDGIIVRAYMPSYVTREVAVIRGAENDFTIKLTNDNSFITIANS